MTKWSTAHHFDLCPPGQGKWRIRCLLSQTEHIMQFWKVSTMLLCKILPQIIFTVARKMLICVSLCLKMNMIGSYLVRKWTIIFIFVNLTNFNFHHACKRCTTICRLCIGSGMSFCSCSLALVPVWKLYVALTHRRYLILKSSIWEIFWGI